MDEERFAQAMALVGDYGPCGASQFVLNRMRETPLEEEVAFKEWHAIGDLVHQIVIATRH